MMEEKLAEVLEHCLKGRKVAVWGIGQNSDKLVGKVLKYCDIDCFISRDAEPGDTYMQKPVHNSRFFAGGGGV
jgi:hypothetical protein